MVHLVFSENTIFFSFSLEFYPELCYNDNISVRCTLIGLRQHENYNFLDFCCHY